MCSIGTAISIIKSTEIQEFYGIQPGEIDVPCFPLFGLFNAAMGVTTVIPDMDASRPARVDPKRLIEHDQRLASDAELRLAGRLGSRRPRLRRARDYDSRRFGACSRPEHRCR